MAIIKRSSSKATVHKLEEYLKGKDKDGKDKTEEKLISGYNCDSKNFSMECKSTNLLYDKNQKEGDRKYYHIIQSFSPQDNDKLTHEQAHKIGMEFVEKNFKGFEVLVVTHKDKEHIHNHFVVNSVSLENGKKYRADNKSLWKMRRDSNELCKINELEYSIQPLDKRAKERYSDGEFRKEMKGEETWKSQLRAQIKITLSKSKNIENFINQLKEKYNVETQLRTKKSKGKEIEIIEYKPQGNRKFFDGEKRLGLEYGKEYIDGITRGNAEQTRPENAIFTGAEQRRNSNGVDTRADNSLNRGSNITKNESIRSGTNENGEHSAQKDIGKLHEQLHQIRGYDNEFNPTEKRNRINATRQAATDQRTREEEDRRNSQQSKAEQRAREEEVRRNSQQSKAEQRDIEGKLPTRNTERER